MQQQPIGLTQRNLPNVSTTHQKVPLQTLDLSNAEFSVGMSLPLSPNPYPITRQSQPNDLHSSPVAEWRDTPRTLYKTSPETEVGDDDVLSDLEVEGTEGEGGTWNEQARPSSLFNTDPQHACMSGETDFTTCNLSSEAAFQTFARRLHADIRSTSSLFPGISLGPLQKYSAPVDQQATLSQHSRTNVAPQGIPDAVDSPTTVAVQPLSIPRKRSMHLNHPPNPINPYQRSKIGDNPPAQRYPAAVIDRAYLRRFRTSSPPQRTVSMKELLVPHAEFRFGYDPEVLASELDSPTTQDFKSSDDPIEDGVVDDLLGDTSPQDANSAPETPDLIRVEAPADDSDCWDIQDNADDGSWTPEGSYEGSYEPRAKRRKTNAGVPSNVSTEFAPLGESRTTHQPSPRTRRAHHDVTKARKRHLQPNLVRTNGCLYGCPLLFSTAYEARRHQEDTHGREEAYSFIKAASGETDGPILAKDYKFLLQIAVHALGDKLEPRARAALDEALEPDSEELKPNLVDTVAKFARDWTKRYECPRCGASFSRLDSKKRHYEKQCR